MLEQVVKKISGSRASGKSKNIFIHARLAGIAPICGGALQVPEKVAKSIAVGLIDIDHTP